MASAAEVLSQPRIAVNVMGGDGASIDGYSKAAYEGACEAAKHGIPVTLIGDQEALPHGPYGDMVTQVHTPGYIKMDDHNFATKAFRDRNKGNLSIVRAMQGLGSGEFSGVVCAGSTGGAMAAAHIVLGNIEGIDRAAIPTPMPFVRPDGSLSTRILLDSGANPETTAQQFVVNALMADEYAKARFGMSEPTMALLTNGAEEGKGTEVDKIVHAFLTTYGEKLGLKFSGNAEGTDLFAERVDILLANGLTGNIALKVAEGLGAMIKNALFGAIDGATEEEMAAFWLIAPRLITPLTNAVSKNRVGGAPLLGVKGNVIISHGSSSAEGITNAIIQAHELATSGLTAAIALRLEQLSNDESTLLEYRILQPKKTVSEDVHNEKLRELSEIIARVEQADTLAAQVHRDIEALNTATTTEEFKALVLGLTSNLVTVK